ncbi:MAG: hypothetical protein GY696_21830 [Gammaproteobacteria bacterium]|nr:hypothetical protein [Gammaproteobacteria bacterium]
MSIFKRVDFRVIQVVVGIAAVIYASQVLGGLGTDKYVTGHKLSVSVQQSEVVTPVRTLHRARCTPGFRCSNGERSVPKIIGKDTIKLALLVGMGGQLKRL